MPAAPVIDELPTPAIEEQPVVEEQPVEETVLETAEPEAVEPEVVEPETVEPEIAEPEVAEPETPPTVQLGGGSNPVIDSDGEEGGSNTLQLTGQTIVATDTTTEVAVVETPTETPVINAEPAFTREAQEFTTPLTKPVIAIILVAENGQDVKNLQALNVPVTIAVSADNPGASMIVAAHRINGGEAMILLPPSGDAAIRAEGEPSEVNRRLETLLATSENVIGIVDGPSGDLIQNTDMLGAVISNLKDTGHAIVSMSGIGVDQTEAIAAEMGVPAISIGQTLSVDSGKVAVIRDMDKASLQLGASQNVVVFGHATPDTISAIGFWLKSLKARNVIVAPVSTAINNK